jgi:hypothetical protein
MFVKKTTKYYKEVSSETEYIVYRSYLCPVNIFGTIYEIPLYVKPDAKIGDPTYWYGTSTTELSAMLGCEIVSITEESLTYNDDLGYNRTGPRDYATDIKETTTTTTVIPGTPDDYTYKEDVLKHYAITKGDKKYILTHNGKYY